MFHEIFFHGQTASSFGLDTDGRMVSFTTPALDSTMVAIERMLPGDEMVRIEGNELVPTDVLLDSFRESLTVTWEVK